MHKIKSFLAVLAICIITIHCTNPAVQLEGVVKNGLEGNGLDSVTVMLKGTEFSAMTDKNGSFSLKVPHSALPGFSFKEINSTMYLKKNPEAPDWILTAEKEGYQQLEYTLSSKPTGLTLNILPEPVEFKASDYTSDYIPYTIRLKEDVKWEDIIDGVRLFYEKRIDKIKPERQLHWNRDVSSPEAYIESVEPNRARFRSIIGAVDEREAVSMEKIRKIAETEKYVVYEVRWPVLREVVPRPALQYWPELDVPRKIYGEGLLLEAKENPRGYAIAVPDADQQPEDLTGMGSGIDEQSQFARRLAENGFTVVVPVVIDRTSRWSRSWKQWLIGSQSKVAVRQKSV
jgi:hypothetical protein